MEVPLSGFALAGTKFGYGNQRFPTSLFLSNNCCKCDRVNLYLNRVRS
jgi:hypothetical protein